MRKSKLTNKTIKENIEIEYYCAGYGSIGFTVKEGDMTFESEFPDSFDPLPSYKAWLEAISTGVMQTSFIYDTEGNEIKFDFEGVYNMKAIFTISNYVEKEKIFFRACVDRRQLVEAFYSGLIIFANSPQFLGDNWEEKYIETILIREYELSGDGLIMHIAGMNREELENSSLIHPFKIRHSKDERSDICRAVTKSDETEDDKYDEEDYKRVIPDDYDTWPMESKISFVKNILNKTDPFYRGMKRRELRSEIIEKYIGCK